MFAKLRKATISCVMSVHRHWTTWLLLDGFSWILYLSIFRKSIENIQVSLKLGKNIMLLYMKTSIIS